MFLITLIFVIPVLVFGRVTQVGTSQLPSDTLSFKNDNGDTDAMDDRGAATTDDASSNTTTNIMPEIPKNSSQSFKGQFDTQRVRGLQEDFVESLNPVTLQSNDDSLNDTNGTDSDSLIHTGGTHTATTSTVLETEENSTISSKWDSDPNKTRSLEMEVNKEDEMEMEETDRVTKTEVSETRRSDGCPQMGPRPKRWTLVKCYCGKDEIRENGRCLPYKKDIFIDAQMGKKQSKAVLVDTYEVKVEDVTCDLAESHRLLNFTKGQFYLRNRGDVVLLKAAGHLEGQRISEYCVIHQLDQDTNLTWIMKGCVPVPSIPRCCPPGKAMKEGSCEPANTPHILTPPIFMSPERYSVEWPKITNYQSPLTCEGKLLKTIPFSKMESHLLSLADGVAYAWKPLEGLDKHNYIRCPHFCVDGKTEPEGSVNYFANICPSLRKCCKHGKVLKMVHNQGRCVTQLNSTFNPPTDMNLSNYNILIGPPLGGALRLDGAIRIDANGNLEHKHLKFPPSEYCVDTFITNGVIEQSALFVPPERVLLSTWMRIRPTLFTVCRAISLVFLGIIIACHILIPELRGHEGVHHLCHAISLAFASASFISLHTTYNEYSGLGCLAFGITMQFGFLATFFWLNVMCFDALMKIRYLKEDEGFKSFPLWSYMLYAFGTPALICLVTVLMQYLAPGDIPGLMKPGIGEGICWFKGDVELLAYFNGPAAILFICNLIFLGLTYYKLNSKKVLKCEDSIHEIRQRSMLFALMTLCWITEILSWKIPPLELWAITDTLNCLQGFFIFVIFVANKNKRNLLKKKFSGNFKNILQMIRTQ